MAHNNRNREILLFITAILPAIFLALFWGQLPAELPIHWNLKGQADGYGPSYVLPLISIGIYFLMLLLPKIDPRKKNYEIFSSSYYKLRLILGVFFTFLALTVMANAIYHWVDSGKITIVSVMLLIAAIGNYFSTIRPNWFIGIRTPWTLDNEVVWRKTHSLGGKLWFWGGLSGLLAVLFLPATIVPVLMGILLAVLIIVPVLYSYLIFKNNHSQELP